MRNETYSVARIEIIIVEVDGPEMLRVVKDNTRFSLPIDARTSFQIPSLRKISKRSAVS